MKKIAHKGSEILKDRYYFNTKCQEHWTFPDLQSQIHCAVMDMAL